MGREIFTQQDSYLSTLREIRSLGSEGLWNLAEECYRQLCILGVTVPISSTVHGIMAHGYRYDDVRRPNGDIKFTAINYVGVLFHQQPGLKNALIPDQQAILARTVGILSECLETIFQKKEEIVSPRFTPRVFYLKNNHFRHSVVKVSAI